MRGYTDVEATYVLGHKTNYKYTATKKKKDFNQMMENLRLMKS